MTQNRWRGAGDNNESLKDPDPGSNQTIQLIILTYRDAAIAEAEARRLRPLSATNLSDGKAILDLSTVLNVVIVRTKTVLLIQDYSGKQREAVTQIAADFENAILQRD